MSKTHANIGEVRVVPLCGQKEKGDNFRHYELRMVKLGKYLDGVDCQDCHSVALEMRASGFSLTEARQLVRESNEG